MTDMKEITQRYGPLVALIVFIMLIITAIGKIVILFREYVFSSP